MQLSKYLTNISTLYSCTDAQGQHVSMSGSSCYSFVKANSHLAVSRVSAIANC